jgi:lysozyme
MHRLDIRRSGFIREDYHGQQCIDWSNLRISSLGNGRRVQGTVNYPVSFAYIKATEGRSVFNKYYPNDLRQARKHGIAVGSYHFFTTTSSGAQQANYFLRMAWIGQSDLPPVLDLEPTEAQFLLR